MNNKIHESIRDSGFQHNVVGYMAAYIEWIDYKIHENIKIKAFR